VKLANQERPLPNPPLLAGEGALLAEAWLFLKTKKSPMKREAFLQDEKKPDEAGGFCSRRKKARRGGRLLFKTKKSPPKRAFQIR
jgi:hypothetical protein